MKGDVLVIKKTAFDRDSFVNGVNYRVDALKSEAEKYLSDTMKSEGKSNVNTDFKETLTQFKSSINISCGGATITKNFFPDEVYKILLASHTVEHKLEIKKIDGTLIKEMQTYISSILGTNNIITTADGKSYKVDTTLASAGLATVTVGGKLYILDWDSNSTAKESLYDLLGSLKTEGNNEITVSGSKVSVSTGSGDHEIQIGTYSNRNSGVSVDAGTGNYGSKVTISGGKGADSIRSEGSKVSISSGAGNDNIEIWKSDVTVDAGAGDDSIYSHGSDYSIFGGAGNDEILVTDVGYVDGGTGIDTIKIQGSGVIVHGGGAFDSLPTKDVFNIGSGASNVYIFDFESADELNLPAGSYTAQIEFGSTAIRNSSGKLIV